MNLIPVSDIIALLSFALLMSSYIIFTYLVFKMKENYSFIDVLPIYIFTFYVIIVAEIIHLSLFSL